MDGVTHVYDTVVLWGAYRDTVCFDFSNRHLCYYPVSERVWRKYSDRERREINNGLKTLRTSARRYSPLKKIYHIRQDKYNELYLIEFSQGERSLMIIITNIVFGAPSYAFTYCHTCIVR